MWVARSPRPSFQGTLSPAQWRACACGQLPSGARQRRGPSATARREGKAIQKEQPVKALAIDETRVEGGGGGGGRGGPRGRDT